MQKDNRQINNDDIFLIWLSTFLPCSIEQLNQQLDQEAIDKIGELSNKNFVFLKWNTSDPEKSYQELELTIGAKLQIFNKLNPDLYKKMELDITLEGKSEIFNKKYAEQINKFKEYLLFKSFPGDSVMTDRFLQILDSPIKPNNIGGMKHN